MIRWLVRWVYALIRSWFAVRSCDHCGGRGYHVTANERRDQFTCPECHGTGYGSKLERV